MCRPSPRVLSLMWCLTHSHSRRDSDHHEWEPSWVNKSCFRIPWGMLAVRVVRGGKFGWSTLCQSLLGETPVLRYTWWGATPTEFVTWPLHDIAINNMLCGMAKQGGVGGDNILRNTDCRKQRDGVATEGVLNAENWIDLCPFPE